MSLLAELTNLGAIEMTEINAPAQQNNQKSSSDQFVEDALNYHQHPKPGKLGIEITKPVDNEQSLALAYTPGVSHAVQAIANDPSNAYKYTAKGNLVAVITNGSAILGMGNLGPLAAKPVMEGKAILFKKCADIDAIDIEVDTKNPDEFIETVARIAPTFGGINLEDIKAPECFYIEEELQKRLNIPVFHDDQHGTAIVVTAALINSLEIQQKKIDEVKIVIIGAGAAAIATSKHLCRMGVDKKQITMIDSKGVIHEDRQSLPEHKSEWAQSGTERTLDDAIAGADVVIGLSGPNLISENNIAQMNRNPIIFALSNPTPEIDPKIVDRVRPDAIIATGRSDYPNQVNNLLCFPYLFRGALLGGSSKITEQMLAAATYAIADLAKQPSDTSDQVSFGPKYIIPKSLDPRLKETVSTAVANASKSTS